MTTSKETESDENQDQGQHITPFFLFSVITAVLGASFQYGWNLGLFNTPAMVMYVLHISILMEE